MPCGPSTPGLSAKSGKDSENDIFGFNAQTELMVGMAGLALMWAAPWRAAMVLADEAIREGWGES